MVNETQIHTRQPAEDSASNPKAHIKQSRFELIRFDRKVNAYIGLCLFSYLLFVIAKWHNSSIPFWNLLMHDGGSEKRGLVTGKPLAIRSDEWMVVSSFILSQENKNLPILNPALGYGRTPFIMGLPVNHVLSIIKPALWGYYFLDSERAFSWQWNFKIFPFLISAFLFLMLFTKNNFLISVFGSFWLFLSSGIQWWSINTEIFTFAFLIVISFIYILYSSSTRSIIVNAIIFTLSAYSFTAILYPAYQVPIGYFMLALVLGYIISEKNFQILFMKKFFKATMLVGSMALLILFAYRFYSECSDTINAVSNTVYPGKRAETGGGIAFISMFKDNFSWFVNESSFPAKWGNICELSSFLMLSPIVTVVLLYGFAKMRKFNALFIPLLIFQFFTYLWLAKGFPEFLAQLTLLKTSPPQRTFFVFGFSNVVLTLLYLGQYKRTLGNLTTEKNKFLAFIGIFMVGFAINFLLNRQSDRFFSIFQIFNATIIFSVLSWLIVYFKESKTYQHLFVAGCFFFVASNVFINPLSKGLAPYLDNEIYKAVSEIRKRDPDPGWIVFGHPAAPNFLKAAGVNCFDGVQFLPPLDKLHVLDPTGVNKDIYNRYGNMMCFSLVNANDSVKFILNQPDLYSIQMDPSSARLRQIGIKYIMFSYRPADIEVRDLVPEREIPGFFIYKRKDL